MPFDILNMLMEKFQQAYKQIQAEMPENPDPVTTEEFEKFKELQTSLSTALYITDKLTEGDKPLSAKDADAASNFYEEYIKTAEAYVKSNDMYKPMPALDLCNEIKDTLVAVRGQAANLKKAAKAEDETKNPSMYDIMEDYGWVENIFNTDPYLERYQKEPREIWKPEEHHMLDNIKKYRNAIAKLPGGFEVHVMNITGDGMAPFDTFERKLNLLQKALDTACLPNDSPVDVTHANKMYGFIKEKFNPENLGELTNMGLVTSRSIQLGLESDFDITIMRGDLENKTNLSAENAKYFGHAIKKLEMKPENLGISPETLQVLDETADYFNVIPQARDFLIQFNDGVDPVKTNDIDSPIFMAVKKANQLEASIKDCILGVPGTRVPSTAEISVFMDALCQSSIRSPLFKAGSRINHNCNSGIQSCEAIAEAFPQLRVHYEQLQQQFQQHMDFALMQPYTDLCRNPVSSREYGVALDRYEALKNDHLLSQKQIDRYEFINMCRYSGYRDQMLQSDDPKQLLIAHIAEYEFNSARAYAESGRSIADMALHPYNHVVANSFFNDRIMTREDIQNFDNYFDQVMESPAVRDLLNRPADEVRTILENGSVGAVIYNNSAMPESLTGDTLNALSQTSGNLHSSNSEEYNNIGDAIKIMAQEAHTPQGISKQTYQSLYNACNVYMCTHNSIPTSPNGKLRFNAAATVLAELAPKMIEKFPDMQDQIERDVKIHMIRSKHFRDTVAANAPEKFSEQAAHIEGVLRATTNSEMITGKAATLDIREALLDKFEQLDNVQNARQAENARRQVEPAHNNEPRRNPQNRLPS